MKLILVLFLLTLIHNSVSPPVLEGNKKDEHDKDSEIKDDLEEYMEYHRYLKEVVAALESDPEFREKLEKAAEDDIRTGKIAEHLDFVNHNIRTQLDEIKRREMERLRHLATQLYEKNNNISPDHPDFPATGHIDHENPHTFEIQDLKKLIVQTTNDLAEADKRRKEDFKKYEMEKEFEQKEKMDHMSEDEKKAFETKLQAEKAAHKKHEPIHHPGSKQQLEEVWEKQDHMDSQDFDPKVFFMMHDVDGNGFWDPQEVAALFVKELDKMYAQGVPGSDIRERQEEMERMREHVFQESDLNKDGLIDFNEFLMQTRKAEYQKDPGWQTLDENQIYTPEEYKQFEQKRREEMRYLQERGLLDAQGRPIQVVYDQQGRPVPMQGQPQYQYQPPPPQYHQQQQYQVPVNQHGQPISQQYVPPPQHQPVAPQYQQQPGVQYQQVPQGNPIPNQNQAQPPVGQPQQQYGQAQPQVGQGQTQYGKVHPQVVQGQPQYGQAGPHVGQAQPQVGQGQPQVGQGQPQVVQGQPQVGQAQPQGVRKDEAQLNKP